MTPNEQKAVDLVNARIRRCDHRGAQRLAKGHYNEMRAHGASIFHACRAALKILIP